ncbi:hypothetical protein GC207_14905 [bacterium]|nr:hypothetical protein [bacterium]
MKMNPSFYLSEGEFQTLVGSGNWKINEIPLPIAVQIRSHFGIDTSYCVLASGIATILPPGPHDEPVGGIDWIRNEDNPQPGEPPFNVYHSMIAQKTNQGYPVFHLGKKDTVAPHWAELEDLKVYFENWK